MALTIRAEMIRIYQDMANDPSVGDRSRMEAQLQAIMHERAVCFEFDGALATSEMTQFGCELFLDGKLPMPAQIAYYESHDMKDDFGLSVGIASIMTPDPKNKKQHLLTLTGNVYGSATKNGEKGISRLPSIRVFAQGDQVGIDCELMGTEAEEVIQYIVAAFFAFTVAMKSKDVEVATIGPAESVRRKREKRGLHPLEEYKRITIKPHLRAAYAKAANDTRHEARSGPRLHFRRGHLRTLPTGEVTPVSPCFVGHIGKGIIHKEYEVKK